MIERLQGISRYSFAAAVVLMSSAFIQFRLLGKFSLWHDESFSAVLSNMSVVDIIVVTVRDVHPPLYYILLKVWQVVAGSGDIALRSFSAFCLLLALLVLYDLIRRHLNASAATAGLTVAALGPFLLRYGIEARMYTLAALLLVASTWLLLRYCEHRERKIAIAYAAALIAMLYTHYFTFPLVLIHGAWLYIYHHPKKSKQLKHNIKHFYAGFKWWFKAVGITMLAFLPWVPILIRQFIDVAGGFWTSAASPKDLLNTLVYYQLNIPLHLLSVSAALAFVASLLVLGIGFYYSYRHQKRARSLMFLLLSLGIAPMIIILAISYLLPNSSVYVDRYFSFYAIFWYGALGLMIHGLRHRALQAACILIIILQFGFGLYNLQILGNFNHHRQTQHDMRQTMEVLNTHHVAGERLIVSSENHLYIYYDAVWYNQTSTQIETINPGYRRGNASLLMHKRPQMLSSLSEVSPGNTVWLITPIDSQLQIPSNWRPASASMQFETAQLQRFEVLPVPSTIIGASTP